VDFVVSSANLKERMGECVYHFGRLLPEKRDGKKMWLYSCCQKERGAVGCYKGVHIFNEREDDVKLASRVGFKLVKDQVEENRASGRVEAFAEVVGMDCEMICESARWSSADARYHGRIFASAGNDSRRKGRYDL
jgi:RNA exonuclease 1